jgi:hypothetical protein
MTGGITVSVARVAAGVRGRGGCEAPARLRPLRRLRRLRRLRPRADERHSSGEHVHDGGQVDHSGKQQHVAEP